MLFTYSLVEVPSFFLYVFLTLFVKSYRFICLKKS